MFNGVTITCFLYILFCVVSYFVGQRSRVAKEDATRRRRFKMQCISATIWGIFLGACVSLRFPCVCFSFRASANAHGGCWTLLGAPIIIASGLYIVWREHVRRVPKGIEIAQ